MFRYFAIVWSETDPAQCAAAHRIQCSFQSHPRWRKSYSAKGVRVYLTDEVHPRVQFSLLEHRRGIVVGTLFRRPQEFDDEPSAPISKLSSTESEQIGESRGRLLIKQYWGNYVAVVHDNDNDTTHILKDPTGTLPCLHTKHQGAHYFFSAIQDYLNLGLTRFHVNWPCVAEHVAIGWLSGETHPLHEMDEISRGECITIDGKSDIVGRTLYWDPTSFAAGSPQMEDPRVAAAALRSTVRHCVRSWTNCHTSLIHRLSGGLDSSIVLSAMTRPPCQNQPSINCLTFYGTDISGDERTWAQLAAEHSHRQLRSHLLDARKISLEPMLKCEPTHVPYWLLSHYLRSGAERTLAHEIGATVLTTGEGGDSNFGSLSITAAIDEYLERHGWNLHALKIATRIAAYRDTSAIRVVLGALRRRTFGTQFHDRGNAYQSLETMLTPELKRLIHERGRISHPLLRETPGTPWGFIHRLGILILRPEYYDPYISVDEMQLEHLHPLYAQPIVELCMSIALFTHFFDGRDRGLARFSFTGDVPDAILRRQWKGRGSIISSQLVYYNLPFLRALLLDGILVRERFLDRRILEQTLTNLPTRSNATTSPILHYMNIELWLRQWDSAAKPQPAEPRCDVSTQADVAQLH